MKAEIPALSHMINRLSNRRHIQHEFVAVRNSNGNTNLDEITTANPPASFSSDVDLRHRTLLRVGR